jgi:formylglycine-generating enzyme required for sulfatase activity
VIEDIKFVYIPGGIVTIGSSQDELDWLVSEPQPFPRDWFEDETPQHELEVSPFLLSRTPITNLQFATLCDDSNYTTDAERRSFGNIHGPQGWETRAGAYWRFPVGDGRDVMTDRQSHPVVHISFEDATSYCQWAGLRLPTESEYEYAAQGLHHRRWPWGDVWEIQSANGAEYWMANLDGAFQFATNTAFAVWHNWWEQQYLWAEGMPLTTDVFGGQFPAQGPFQLIDVVGNVYEWTSSLTNLYGKESNYHPMFQSIVDRYRVVKGGSFMNLKYQLRCAERMHCDPKGWSNFAIGFRCASDV